MQRFVAGFMFCNANLVPLVRKKKPTWMAGMLNAIGGAIESDETPYFAMGREWREETGFDYRDWDHYCSITDGNTIVYFFRARVRMLPFFLPTNDVGEEIDTFDADLVSRRQDIVPNLSWLVPLALDQSNFRVVGGDGARVGLPPMQMQAVRP